jgi:tetratricopeptide (TPR) repeat protein
MAVGCVSPDPGDTGPERRITAPQSPMTVRQARKVASSTIIRLYDGLYHKGTVQDLKITRHRIEFAFAGDDRYDCVMAFAALGNFSVRTRANGKASVYSNGKSLGLTSVAKTDGKSTRANGWAVSLEDFKLPFLESEREALTLVDALLTLKEAEGAPAPEDAEFAAFSEGAKLWLATTPKPPMSDDARLSKVVAEDAFKRKDFAAALDGYCDALEKHPMWPEGHYNAALLAAQIEDYELAARHIRRYLALAPEAKDAPAAKDKLLLWEHKAKQ